MEITQAYQAGTIVIFGSGETSPSGRKAFDRLLRRLPKGAKIALLETPAGFELNSAQVIGRVGEFIGDKLQNYAPQTEVVRARRRGTPLSPDTEEIIAPLYQAEVIFMGPGSPSYAVRQLKGSLAWQALLASHRLGAAVVFASAAAAAVSQFSLPVYEIYKVGEELHWKEGLDFFGVYGLKLVIIPHWNNNDGGAELDTSRCFMGAPRFAALMEMLPEETTVVGVDEKTALLIDPASCICRVIGQGGVTLLHSGPAHRGAALPESPAAQAVHEIAARRGGHAHYYKNGQIFFLGRIGALQDREGGEGLPAAVWERALAARSLRNLEAQRADLPSQEVQDLVEERQEARQRKDWAAADRLRQQIAALGWQVQDTPDGAALKKLT
jgi:cyanophycinase-like exopeptidase